MPEPLPPLVVRADANGRIGSGHLMRGFALALEWKKRGGAVRFLSRCESAGWRERLEHAGFALKEPGVDEFASVSGRTWLMIDGYDFGPEYLAKARQAARTLVVDDYGHRPRLPADVVLNQNLGAERLRYAFDDDTLALIGPGYALLRPEFTKQPARSFRGRARRVLVTLGGSDPDNATAKAIAALPPDVEALVVLGAAYSHEPARYPNVRYERDVKDMHRLMAWAEVGVIAGGTTAWEACFMGLPCAILVLAENQAAGAAALDAAGAAVAAGDALADRLRELVEDPALRAKVSARAAALVDGKGASRVVDAMLARDYVRH